MDKLMNLAVEGLKEYSESQQSVQKTGGENYTHEGSHGQSGIQIDHAKTAQIAGHHSGSSGTTDIFSQALSFVSTTEEHTPVDEEHLTKSHQNAYADDQASSLDAHSLGSAAAVQVLKNFTSGGESHAGGDVQSQLIGQAMAEALKLFDSSGAKGNKQDAVNSAAMTMMKLMVQSKFSGGGTTGGNPTSTLMDLASKFI